MNHATITESWIAHELLNDGPLDDIVHGKIYYGAPEEEVQGIYVVFNQVSGTPFYNLGTKREHSVLNYDIVVWQSGSNTLDMKNAADRIDVLFSSFRNRTFTRSGQTYRFYSQTERFISLKNYTEPPLKWRGMGAEYRISATKQ